MTDQQLIEELESEESMFVQTAQGITSDGTTLTLKGVTPATLYFSDRPKRIVGHMTTADFVDLWGEGDNSFQEDPPNAVLAFLEPGDNAPEDAVVVIQQPRLEDGNLIYAIDALEGTLPAEAGPGRCSSTPSAGRSHPYPYAACADASGAACADGSSARHKLAGAPSHGSCVPRSSPGWPMG